MAAKKRLISRIDLKLSSVFSDFFSTELLIYQIKNLEFFLLFLLFVNLDKIAPSVPIEKIIKWYIVASLILIAVNLIGVLLPNPICYKYIGRGLDSSMYTGRLSLGQPAMASFPIMLSFIWFWVKSFDGVRSFVMPMIFLAYVILSPAMTAYVIVIAVIMIKLFVEMKKVEGFKRNMWFLLFLMIIEEHL